MRKNALNTLRGGAAALYGGFAAVAFMVTLGTSPWTTEATAGGGDDWKAAWVRPTSVPFPEENPYTTEKATLGQKLFFDPRLSGSDYISCATCHNPGFAWGDGLPTGYGHKMAKLGRRTPTILNSAWGELTMWDGRKDSLEEQALGPIGGKAMKQDVSAVVEELTAIPGYRTLFNVAFPGEGITLENIAKALATYERTIVSGIAPFDRWIAGDQRAISAAAKRGFDLFNNKANCAACHTGWSGTDSGFHDIGLPDDDIGRGKIVKNVVKLQHAFKTPTLRSIAQRAPYMHDGSLGTLKEVIDHYNDGFTRRESLSDEIKPLNLSEDEKADLLAFLLTFEGDDPAVVSPVLPANEQVPGAWLQRLSPAAGGKAETAECRTARLHLDHCN